MRYTALDGGDALRQNAAKAAAWPTPAAQGNPPQPLGFKFPQTNLTRLFSAKHEFATDWVKFMNPMDPTNTTLSLDFSQERFPFQFRGKTITITQVGLYLILDDVVAAQITSSPPPVLPVTLASPPTSPGGTLKPDAQLNGVLDSILGPGNTLSLSTGTYALVIAQSDIAKLPPQLFTATAGVGPVRLNPTVVRDLIVVCTYSASSR
jgi:hypothetical protein